MTPPPRPMFYDPRRRASRTVAPDSVIHSQLFPIARGSPPQLLTASSSSLHVFIFIYRRINGLASLVSLGITIV